MPKPFGPDHPGNMKGRPKGTKNWWTEARDQLREALPEAIAHVKAGAAAGDPDMIKLLFSVVFPRTKAVYPSFAVNLATQSPREVLDAVNAALAEGAIAVDHAAAVLDLLAKEKRLETAIVLAGRVIDAPMIGTAQSLAAAAVESFDLDTLTDTMRTGLPYLQPRPQPEPPEATGTVSHEPIGLDGEDWEAKYSNPDGAKND